MHPRKIIQMKRKGNFMSSSSEKARTNLAPAWVINIILGDLNAKISWIILYRLTIGSHIVYTNYRMTMGNT